MKKTYDLKEIEEVIEKCISNPAYRVYRGFLSTHKEVHLPSLKANILLKLKERKEQ